jgi:hypothetical protein
MIGTRDWNPIEKVRFQPEPFKSIGTETITRTHKNFYEGIETEADILILK